eukprot:5593297-Pleurochrysis_carterae.AAC.1
MGFALSLPNRKMCVLQLQTLASRGQRGRKQPRGRRFRHRPPQRSAPRDCSRPEAQAPAALLHGLRVD